jgi:hypothetical protein
MAHLDNPSFRLAEEDRGLELDVRYERIPNLVFAILIFFGVPIAIAIIVLGSCSCR